jgi:tetratricopeptide (TPR) repeat protein
MGVCPKGMKDSVPYTKGRVYDQTVGVFRDMRFFRKTLHGGAVFGGFASAYFLLLCICGVTYGEGTKSAQTAASPLALADQAYSEGRFQDAVKLYSQVSDRAEGFFGSGMANEMLNRADKAAEDYRKAIEADPAHYKAMENLAGIYERGGEHISEAIKYYKQALKLEPRKEWQENLASCVAMLQSRLKHENSSPVGCWHMANKRALAGDDREAELLYTRSTRLNPDMFQAYFSRGLLRLKLGRLQEALDDFDETARIAPKYRGAYVQKGLTHQKLGDSAAARESFERAAQNDPRDPEAWYHLGCVLEETKQYPMAMECYQEALGLRTKPDLGTLIRERVSAVWTSGSFDSKKNSTTLKKLKELW